MILDVGITVAKISDEREGSVDILLPRRSEDEILFFTQATDSTSLEPVKTQKSNELASVISGEPGDEICRTKVTKRVSSSDVLPSTLLYFSLNEIFS